MAVLSEKEVTKQKRPGKDKDIGEVKYPGANWSYAYTYKINYSPVIVYSIK